MAFSKEQLKKDAKLLLLIRLRTMKQKGLDTKSVDRRLKEKHGKTT